MPLFLTQKFFIKVHEQTRILPFHLKNMKYSAVLPMFVIWHENLLLYDNMRVLYFVACSGGQRDLIFLEIFMKKIFTKFCFTYSENNLLKF